MLTEAYKVYLVDYSICMHDLAILKLFDHGVRDRERERERLAIPIGARAPKNPKKLNINRKNTIFLDTIYLILLHRIGTPAVGKQ